MIYTVHGSHSVDIASSPRLEKHFLGLGFRLKVHLERWLLTRIRYDATITVAKNFLRYPNQAKKIYVIPNGADLPRVKNQKLRVKRKINLLFVGRLDKVKGVEFLLRALAKVKPEIPEFELIIIGRGPEKEALEKQAQRLGLKGNVEFLGLVKGKKLAKQYGQADLFILPSLAEGQPIVVLEAWASGLPVLATKVGHNPFMIKEGENGFLTEPGSVSSLQKSLKRALEKRRLWQKIGKNGFELVKKRYTWENMVTKTIKVYQKTIKGGDDAA